MTFDEYSHGKRSSTSVAEELLRVAVEMASDESHISLLEKRAHVNAREVQKHLISRKITPVGDNVVTTLQPFTRRITQTGYSSYSTTELRKTADSQQLFPEFLN